MEGENDHFTSKLQKEQNDKYGMIFRVLRDFKDIITGVTFWGVADNSTWLDNYPVNGRKNYPMLFDENLKPKAVFYNIVNFK